MECEDNDREISPISQLPALVTFVSCNFCGFHTSILSLEMELCWNERPGVEVALESYHMHFCWSHLQSVIPYTYLSTFPLFSTELHHSVRPITMKIVHTKQLIHTKADTILLANKKYTAL